MIATTPLNKPGLKPSLDFPLVSSLIPIKGIGTATFTRATTATLEEPVDGLIKTVKAGEIRFKARRVENLVPKSEDFTTWVKVGMNVVTGTSDPLGGTTAATITATAAGIMYIACGNNVGRDLRLSIWVKRETGTGNFSISQNGVYYAIPQVTSQWNRVTIPVFVGNTGNGGIQYFDIDIVTGDSFSIWHPQFEDVTGQANQNPSEYVSNGVLSTPYHGANVDGVKYFDTYNGNTVVDNVVTEATGSNIPEASLQGAMIEVASTNLIAYSNTFNATNWPNNGITFTGGFLSPDGSLNATKLTNTIPQLGSWIYRPTASTNATNSIYAKYDTCTWVYIFFYSTFGATNKGAWFNLQTGTIGTASAGVTATMTPVANGFYRLSAYLASTEYVSSVMFGFANADNSIISTDVTSTIVYQGQCEALPMATSPIFTTTATVTRNADVLTYPNASNVSDTQGTVLMEATPYFDIPNSLTGGYGNNFLLDFGSISGILQCTFNLLRRYDGTTLVGSPAWVPLKNTTYKIGSRYGSAGQRNWLNGNAGTNEAFDGSINISANMKIGGIGSSAEYNWGGFIKNIKIYKKVLSDAKISQFTS